MQNSCLFKTWDAYFQKKKKKRKIKLSWIYGYFETIIMDWEKKNVFLKQTTGNRYESPQYMQFESPVMNMIYAHTGETRISHITKCSTSCYLLNHDKYIMLDRGASLVIVIMMN